MRKLDRPRRRTPPWAHCACPAMRVTPIAKAPARGGGDDMPAVRNVRPEPYGALVSAIPSAERTGSRQTQVPEVGQIVSVRGATWAEPACPAAESAAQRTGRCAESVAARSDALASRGTSSARSSGRLGAGARPQAPAARGLPTTRSAKFDDPNRLAAFVDALRWGAVTSADARRSRRRSAAGQRRGLPARAARARARSPRQPAARRRRRPRQDDRGRPGRPGAAPPPPRAHGDRRLPGRPLPQVAGRDAQKFGLDFEIVNSETMRESGAPTACTPTRSRSSRA